MRWGNVATLLAVLGFAHVVMPPVAGLPFVEQVALRVGVLLIGLVGYAAGWRYYVTTSSHTDAGGES